MAVPDVDMQDCLRTVFEGLRFTPPADGYVGVIYPFVFTRAE